MATQALARQNANGDEGPQAIPGHNGYFASADGRKRGSTSPKRERKWKQH